MARILIGTVPLTGHVSPGIPIAEKLLERGHEVLWYTGKRFKKKVESLGAHFAPFKRALDYDEPNIDETFPGLTSMHGIKQQRCYIGDVFFKHIKSQYEDMKEIMEEFHADAILADPAFAGFMPFAERGEKPCAVYGFMAFYLSGPDAAPYGMGLRPGSSPLSRMRNRVLNWLVPNVIMREPQAKVNRVRAEMGLPPLKRFVLDQIIHSAHLYMQCTPRKFEFERRHLPPHIMFVGPILPKSQKTMEFEWWDDLESGKPVVHVTQGTLDNTDLTKVFIPSLKALAGMDVLVVATTGGRPVESLDKDLMRPNIRIEEFIPYSQLLPHVDVMVTNGGIGGINFALSHGVPLVAAGNSEEKMENATRVEYSGTGIDLRTGKPRPSQIRKAVLKILSDPKYKARARELQADFAGHDAAREMALQVEKLISHWQKPG